MLNLGRKVAQKREERGLSLREAEPIVGFCYEEIRRVERGATSLHLAIRVARALGIPKREILAAAQRDVALLVRAA